MRRKSNDWTAKAGSYGPLCLRMVRSLNVRPFSFVQVLRQRSDLPEKLGCTLVKEGPFKGMVEVDQFGFTGVDGLYVIGDASRGIPQVVTAVSDGALAAIAANTALLTEDAQ
jgi:NADPH-dependent glutamate synthase beta subunit-like oxidoreductase